MKQAVIESYLRRAVINCRESSLSATEIQDLIRMTSAGKSVATRYRSLCRALHNNQRTKPLRSKMTSTTKPITPLCQRMIDDMRMRKLSPKTQASYIRVVKRFSRLPPLERSPNTASAGDLRSYQMRLVDHGISPISLNATTPDSSSSLKRHWIIPS